ncbi:MAG: right-handed parallel beta-helix repeat-containing protein [Candidatus Hodarchaeales archaeon]
MITSYYNSVVNNTIENNEDRIQLSNSHYNKLINNKINKNLGNGITLVEFSCNNNLKKIKFTAINLMVFQFGRTHNH